MARNGGSPWADSQQGNGTSVLQAQGRDPGDRGSRAKAQPNTWTSAVGDPGWFQAAELVVFC